MNNNDTQYIPEIVSVQHMARLLHISRSRLYSLMDEGVFLKPVYSLNKKRPHFTRQMALRNLSAKRNNLGINGTVVLFYSSRSTSIQKMDRSTKGKVKPTPQSKYVELKEGLESLGLTDITDPNIGSALTKCFPNGTDNIGEDEILTTIFRHFKCQNSSDNVGR